MTILRIIDTTDKKYLGTKIQEPEVDDIITFNDGFEFKVKYKIETGSIIKVINDNYIITLQRS
jgi:hypothetical protein